MLSPAIVEKNFTGTVARDFLISIISSNKSPVLGPNQVGAVQQTRYLPPQKHR